MLVERLLADLQRVQPEAPRRLTPPVVVVCRLARTARVVSVVAKVGGEGTGGAATAAYGELRRSEGVGRQGDKHMTPPCALAHTHAHTTAARMHMCAPWLPTNTLPTRRLHMRSPGWLVAAATVVVTVAVSIRLAHRRRALRPAAPKSAAAAAASRVIHEKAAEAGVAVAQLAAKALASSVTCQPVPAPPDSSCV